MSYHNAFHGCVQGYLPLLALFLLLVVEWSVASFLQSPVEKYPHCCSEFNLLIFAFCRISVVGPQTHIKE